MIAGLKLLPGIFRVIAKHFIFFEDKIQTVVSNLYDSICQQAIQ